MRLVYDVFCCTAGLGAKEVRREGSGGGDSGCAGCSAASASDGGCRRHRLLKVRPAALMCARAMMTQRQKLSKNEAQKYSAVYLIHVMRHVAIAQSLTAEPPASANGCLWGATCQLRVLVGGAVNVTSGSSGVDEGGFQLQRRLCPIRVQNNGCWVQFASRQPHPSSAAKPSRIPLGPPDIVDGHEIG